MTGPYGDLKAVLHSMPRGENGVSLDLLCCDRAADPGMDELLVVAALRTAPQRNIARVSLIFARFRSAPARGEKLDTGPVPHT